MSDVIYSTGARSATGRGGAAVGDDDAFEFDLSVPEEMGGLGGAGTNPEQLFAAGYAACFSTALTGAARRRKVEVHGSSVHVTVALVKRDDEGFRLKVDVKASLPDVDPAVAGELVRAADRVCPYSDALRGNAQVSVQVDNGGKSW